MRGTRIGVLAVLASIVGIGAALAACSSDDSGTSSDGGPDATADGRINADGASDHTVTDANPGMDGTGPETGMESGAESGADAGADAGSDSGDGATGDGCMASSSDPHNCGTCGHDCL